jgi:hypothetical protein
MSGRQFQRATATAALSMLAFACAPIMSKTPVTGTSIARLVGEWQGTYESPETGRSGAISFVLRAASDTAQGEILITVRPVPAIDTDNAAHQQHSMATPPPPVTIRFVVVRGDEVSGTLDPYADPECGCQLKTVFLGTIAGDEIRGTFQSDGSGFFHAPTHGTWRVMRKR